MHKTELNNIDFKKLTEKGTEKGKTNMYCFYDIILLFKSIQGRGLKFSSI